MFAAREGPSETYETTCINDTGAPQLTHSVPASAFLDIGNGLVHADLIGHFYANASPEGARLGFGSEGTLPEIDPSWIDAAIAEPSYPDDLEDWTLYLLGDLDPLEVRIYASWDNAESQGVGTFWWGTVTDQVP